MANQEKKARVIGGIPVKVKTAGCPACSQIRPWSVNAVIWHRKFLEALNRRISLTAAPAIARRKYCDSYLERLAGARRGRRADAAYLRRFASRGASCLDWR